MRCASGEPADAPCRGEREGPRPSHEEPRPPAVGRPAAADQTAPLAPARRGVARRRLER